MRQHPDATVVVGGAACGRALARALARGGNPILICGGPPACVLDREDRCPLVDAVGTVVQVASADAADDVIIALRRCAEQARRCVVVGATEGAARAAQ